MLAAQRTPPSLTVKFTRPSEPAATLAQVPSAASSASMLQAAEIGRAQV